MKNPGNSRSRWWWTQKAIALLGSIALGYWLWLFIDAATMTASVTQIAILAPERAAVELHPIADGGKDDSAEARDALRIPTVKTQQGNAVELLASFQPDIDLLPSAVTSRIAWTALAIEADGTWSATAMAGDNGNPASCTCRADEAGTYLVIVALPPVSLDRLDGSTSSYIQKFLTSSAVAKSRALQIVVSGSPSKEAPQKHAVKDTGVVVNLKHRLEPPPPPPPPLPPAPQPPVPERDLSMSHSGDQPDGTTDTQKPVSGEMVAQNSALSGAVLVPPHTPAKPAPAKLNWGTLPETTLEYERAEVARLSVTEWQAICRAYGMPFVAVPGTNHFAEIGGWIVLTPDGDRKVVAPDKVERLFGLKYIPLSALSDEVQSANRVLFNDPVVWFKCNEQRGFLLSSFLLEAIQAGLDQHGISVEDAGKVKRIAVSLAVDRSGGSCQLRAVVTSVEMKEQQ